MNQFDTLFQPEPKPLDALIEDARLAALAGYRTLPPEVLAGLSLLSQETATVLGATQAAVSFVDGDRVWFGGAFGFSQSDLARENSFCDTVVRSSSPLLVPDALVDPRFRRHELISGAPGLRSYAGVPLIDGGGYTLGTVAVYSVAPAMFATSIMRQLSDLATLVRDFLAEARTPPMQPVPVRRVQGWLGVKTVELKAGETVASEPGGLLILSVAKRSPAEQAGLRPTDILYSIGAQALTATADVAAAMAGRPTGGSVQVRFRRAGQWQGCEVEIRPRRRRLSVR